MKYQFGQISINSEHFSFWDQNFDIKIEIGMFQIANVPKIYLGLTGGKYLIKTNFDIKIEIVICEISNVPNFNKFGAFSILEPIWA